MELQDFERAYLLKASRLLGGFKECIYKLKNIDMGPWLERVKVELLKGTMNAVLIKDDNLEGIIVFRRLYECLNVLIFYLIPLESGIVDISRFIVAFEKFIETKKKGFKRIMLQGNALCFDDEQRKVFVEHFKFIEVRRCAMSIPLKSSFEVSELSNEYQVVKVDHTIANELGEAEYQAFKGTADELIMFVTTEDGHKTVIKDMIDGKFGTIDHDTSFAIKDTKTDKIIGAIICLQRGVAGFIIDIFVIPEYQSQGLGKWMLLTALNKMIDKGIITTELAVTKSNKKAFGFYKKVGFRVAEEGVLYVKNFEDKK